MTVMGLTTPPTPPKFPRHPPRPRPGTRSPRLRSPLPAPAYVLVPPHPSPKPPNKSRSSHYLSTEALPRRSVSSTFHDGPFPASSAQTARPSPPRFRTATSSFLPPRSTAGQNLVETKIPPANIAPGKAITRFEDHDDGQEYLYTLFVPMGREHGLSPASISPTLKGRFKLHHHRAPTGPRHYQYCFPTGAFSSLTATTAFAETEPIPPYSSLLRRRSLRSTLHPQPGMPNRLRPRLQKPNPPKPKSLPSRPPRRGIRYLSDYFAQPFPFPNTENGSYIPGLSPTVAWSTPAAPSSAKSPSCFRTAPTATQPPAIPPRHPRPPRAHPPVVRRLPSPCAGSTNLWLKEGFAQYMAYKTLAALRPTTTSGGNF